MGLYEGIKDVAKIAQQADNIDLYKKLLDLSAQALEMQDEIRRLKKENSQLKKDSEFNKKIVRHIEPFITINGGSENIRYCAICWGNIGKLIQVNCNDAGEFYCQNCTARGIYDKNKYHVAINGLKNGET